MAGKAAKQGPHQVAQKSNTTVFPFKSASETVLPLKSLSSKEGAD
jgi:hypothetical protein